MGKIPKFKKVRDFASRNRTGLISAGLVGATVGMQAFGAHYLIPGYGIPVDSEGVKSSLHTIGTGASEYAYKISSAVSEATTNYDPHKPFFYIDMVQDKTFSYIFNSLHHALGGVAIGYVTKKYLIDPIKDKANKIKGNNTQKTVGMEESFKEYDKLISKASLMAFCGIVGTASILWEAYEMNFFSDKLVTLPAFLSDPDTYDGLKDLGFNALGAYAVYRGVGPRKVISKIIPKKFRSNGLETK